MQASSTHPKPATHLQSVRNELPARDAEFAGYAAHGPPNDPYEFLHAQAVALMLAAGESVPGAHG